MWIKIKDDNEVDLSVNIYKDELEIAQYDNVYIFIENNVAFSTLELETGRKKEEENLFTNEHIVTSTLTFHVIPEGSSLKKF